MTSRSSPPWPTSTATAIDLGAGRLGDPADGDGGVQAAGVGEDDALGHGSSLFGVCCRMVGLGSVLTDGCVDGRSSRGQARKRAASATAGLRPSRGDDQDRVVAGDGAEDRRQVRRGRWPRRGTARHPAACAGRRGCADASAVTSSSAHSRASRAASTRRPGRRPGGAVAALARARRRRGRRTASRTFTAPSSTRSRESVAWVTVDALRGEQLGQLAAASAPCRRVSSESTIRVPGGLGVRDR